ncbi:hypothetical protein WJX72_003330 [[Myrmecia] bisecta]|uniref:Uncharacterized protein n=1 Tax=[Myrmecia] bisecta TaxID=41462 RepID=A0AAW1R5T7_9CHLO
MAMPAVIKLVPIPRRLRRAEPNRQRPRIVCLTFGCSSNGKTSSPFAPASTQPGSPQRTHRGEWSKSFLFFTGFPFPIGPVFERATVRQEVVPGSVWIFDQEQSVAGINVATTVRMTAVKLKGGSLLIYAPIAPTEECINLVKELNAPVEHIVLSSHAYEHKVFVAPFSRAFPRAQIWHVPGQWSFPLPLPLPLLGIFGSKPLNEGDSSVPWTDELDFKVLVASLGAAPYCEVALFHKQSRTLLVTDAVVYISDTPPEVVDRPRLQRAGSDNLFCKLLFAFDKPQNPQSMAEQESLGWKRNALLVSYFSPQHVRDPVGWPAIGNRLIVSPVTQTLVFSQIPGPTRKWVDRITGEWRFERIIACHFNSPIEAGPAEFRKAFTFVYEMENLKSRADNAQRRSREEAGLGFTQTYPMEDLKALLSLNSICRKLGVVRKEPLNS